VLPSRVVVHLLLAGCLFAELGYRQVWHKLTAGLGRLPVAEPSDNALWQARARLGAAPLRWLSGLLRGPATATACGTPAPEKGPGAHAPHVVGAGVRGSWHTGLGRRGQGHTHPMRDGRSREKTVPVSRDPDGPPQNWIIKKSQRLSAQQHNSNSLTRRLRPFNQGSSPEGRTTQSALAE
jgi:hypothetical protein